MEKISQFLPSALAIALAFLMVGCTKSNATTNQVDDAAANVASNKTNTTPEAKPQINSEDKKPLVKVQDAIPEAQPHANSEDKMPRVKAQDAMKEVAAGQAVIIDVRGTEAYKLKHIKGALDVPLPKIESKDFNGLPKDKRIIAYCT